MMVKEDPIDLEKMTAWSKKSKHRCGL